MPEGPPTVRQECGTTLLEMVLACALLGLLLVCALAAQTSAREANEVNRETGHRSQIGELAAELLTYHLSAAGHRGLAELQDLGGPPLALGNDVVSGSDALTVRYVEERWYEQPTLRVLHFDVKRDSGGRWNLYLREEGATRQPAVQKVSGLQVERMILADGSSVTGDAALPVEVVALQLRLDFAWGDSRRLTVALPAPTVLVGEGA